MNPQPYEISEDLSIVGIALSTSPKAAARDIPAFWQRFMSEGVAAKAAGQNGDGSIYAVYCDYESDHRGSYTMLLGVAVAPSAEVPADMRRVRVVKGRYAEFAVKGDPTQVVWQTWDEINQRWPGRSERRYVSDFERYRPDSLKDGTLEVELGVSLI